MTNKSNSTERRFLALLKISQRVETMLGNAVVSGVIDPRAFEQSEGRAGVASKYAFEAWQMLRSANSAAAREGGKDD